MTRKRGKVSDELIHLSRVQLVTLLLEQRSKAKFRSEQIRKLRREVKNIREMLIKENQGCAHNE